MALTFTQTLQSNSVQFEFGFDWSDIVSGAGGASVLQIPVIPGSSLWSKFFDLKAYFVESIFLQKTEDFEATGKDFWLGVSQVAYTGATVHKMALGSLVPISKVNTGIDEEVFGVERLLASPSLALQPPPWPLRYIEGVVPEASAAGTTHTAWARFGAESGNGSVSSVYVERDSYIVDMQAWLLSSTNLADPGTITLNPYICDALTLPPDAANFAVAATPWATTAVPDAEAPSIEFSAGVRRRPQTTDPQAFAFVPAGSYLAVRSYKDGGSLTPHTADIGVRLTLVPAVGRGYAFAHGGLPYVGKAPDDNHTWPVGWQYPVIHAIINNGANMSDLKQGAAKVVMLCRRRTF